MDIVDMFAKEIKMEIKIQEALSNLIENEDFHTIDAFRLFDIEEKGEIDTY